MKCDLLIVNATLLPEPGRGELQDNGYLAITGSKISDLGPMAKLAGNVSGRQIIDVQGNLVMPGLVNTHAHGAMTLFRGLADDLELMSWLNEHIFPAEAAFVEPEMVYWCSKLAAAEMILAGITTVADGYFHEDAAARAFAEAGIRAVAAQGVIDFPAPGVPDPVENIKAAAEFIEKWQGANPLITPGVFCHSPYTCGPQTLARAKELCRAKGAPFFIHVAETGQEVAQLEKEHGLTPIAFLHDLGLLDRDTVCVHGVWLTDADLALLEKSGAGVASCPESNMKLAAGLAPIGRMRAANIPVGLGTDGCASNNDLDLLQEMGMCAKLHKMAAGDATVLPGRVMLAMATAGGARVLGMGEKVGALRPGMDADCIVVDLARPNLTPFYNQETLVYAGRGSDVVTSIINGKVVMAKRELLTFDLGETMTQVRRISRRVKAAV
ncbi:MAG: amidohydrolase [Desulfobulbaceae bacterium]|nr:amidohydrolase [Desulfobulbaceae bacterium]HIJ79592.1 amidohydrolase [Deltaproteobacteria bacterium]